VADDGMALFDGVRKALEEGDGDFLRRDQGPSVGADWHRQAWLATTNG
jgi:hypothetical protein